MSRRNAGCVVETFAGSMLREGKDGLLWSSNRYTLFQTRGEAMQAIRKTSRDMRERGSKVNIRKFFHIRNVEHRD